MPSYAVVEDVLNTISASLPKTLGGFPPCQICNRSVKHPIAATNGLYWYFGHPRCVPNGYWMHGEDFNHLASVLDWAYHLSEKHTLDRESWLELVAYVRPQWEPAAREVVHRFFHPTEAMNS